MKPHSCRQIRSLLVEYADHELDSGDSATVSTHVAGCLACREALLRLQLSIDVYQDILNECSEPPIKARLGSHVKASAARAVLVLAVTLLFAVSLWPLLTQDQVNQTQALESSRDLATANEMTAISDPLTIDVQQTILRATMAAQLEASSAALATDPQLGGYRERADRILATAFADLDAGRRAKLRLDQ